MKKNYLVLTILLCVSMCKPMDNDAARATCKKVEQINPNASPEQYIALIKTLRNAQLSVCDCIKQISEDRINAQKPALEKEWKISEQNWKDIDAITQKIKQQDNQPDNIVIKVDHDSFPKDYRLGNKLFEHLAKKFNEAGCSNNTITITYQPPQEIKTIDGTIVSREIDTTVSRPILFKKSGDEYPIDHEHKRIKPEVIKTDDYLLQFGSPFFDYSSDGQQGNLLHEINGHIPYNDSVQNTLLFMSACIYDPELLNNPQRFRASSSVLNTLRAKEARADQIPAACTTLNNARLIERWLIEAKNMMGNSGHNPAYDSDHDRIAMATRIRKLKEAEEYLDKKIIPSAQNKRSLSSWKKNI